jgi:hypothetical protein
MTILFYLGILMAIFGAVVWFKKWEPMSRLEAWVFNISKVCFAGAIATVFFVQLIECAPDLEMRTPGGDTAPGELQR